MTRGTAFHPRTSPLNERLAWVLRRATGQSFSAKPEEWWAWWNQRNEVYSSGSKPVSTIYDSETRTVVDRTSGSVPGVGISLAGSTPAPAQFECLAAGTVVWTIKGPLEIELIRVGDQVLSQDSETGELAFKPVLKTTIRPASPLVRIAAGVDTIQASGGHLFWVAGEGWIKARDLQSGQVLHGARGPVHVSFVEPGEQAQTYNLVVAVSIAWKFFRLL